MYRGLAVSEGGTMANGTSNMSEDDGRIGKRMVDSYEQYKWSFGFSPGRTQRTRRVADCMDLAKARQPDFKAHAGKKSPGSVAGSKQRAELARRESKDDHNAPLLFGFRFTEVRALLLLNVIAVLYGTNTTIMKDILNSTHHRASTATVARSFTAAMAIIPIVLMDRKRISPALWRAGLDVGFWLAFGCFCQSNSLLMVTSSEASVMLALTIVIVSVLELMIGRKPTTRRILPVVVALTGLAMMEAGNDGGDDEDYDEPRGILGLLHLSEGTAWGIASAVGFGVHLFRSDVVQETVSESESIKLGGIQLVTCAGYHVIWVIWDMFSERLQGTSMPLDLQELPWLEILFCGVVSTGLAQFLELVCVKHAKASSTAIVFAQVPVWGLLLGFFFHGDRLSFVSLLGSSLVVVAAMVPYFLTLLGFDAVPDTVQEKIKRKSSSPALSRHGKALTPSAATGKMHLRSHRTDIP